MSTTLEEYVRDLQQLLGQQQGTIGNKLVNGNFSTLEEAKTMSGQVRGLEMAKELAAKLMKNRSLLDEPDAGGGLTEMGTGEEEEPEVTTRPSKQRATGRGGKRR